MVEGSMTQGAGQGPDVWHGAGAAPRRAQPPVPPPPPPVPRRGADGGAGARTGGDAGAGEARDAHGPVMGATEPEPMSPPGLSGPVSAQRPVSAPGPVDTPSPAAGGRPAGYTPTQRDLPVVKAASVREPTLVDSPSPAPAATPHATGATESPLYVVGDVHGYLDELRAALLTAGLIDGKDRWAAGNARLWFLGDFTDRGPDGIGVIDLVMNLSAEAAAAGGYCKALMGNHELLLIGAKRFGETPVNSGAGTASFQAAWLLNGGQRTDMERLEEHHIQWMSRLDAMALADRHLLVHSDATCYLEYGDTIESVNDAVTIALQNNDADETWDLFRKFTKRFAFREEGAGTLTARELLDTFGGERIVHGHSPIPYLLGEVGSEDDDSAPPNVTGPHLYADGLAVAMDGGVTMAGKLLVTQLPLAEQSVAGKM
ncbi:metallophosphoesterase [Streptomyces sp. N2-109]|uniref:Metallophosphoesterase n=1 Tax=Streptomyces gossypii TaxID=2883101 RepID=A0ABT2JN91_9ACTN|nr:metallophosphoesterase [Streptomyces gossypii]MCT2589291.1 metallophosphoesterase [Streptomyces gossypii]